MDDLEERFSFCICQIQSSVVVTEIGDGSVCNNLVFSCWSMGNLCSHYKSHHVTYCRLVALFPSLRMQKRIMYVWKSNCLFVVGALCRNQKQEWNNTVSFALMKCY